MPRRQQAHLTSSSTSLRSDTNEPMATRRLICSSTRCTSCLQGEKVIIFVFVISRNKGASPKKRATRAALGHASRPGPSAAALAAAAARAAHTRAARRESSGHPPLLIGEHCHVHEPALDGVHRGRLEQLQRLPHVRLGGDGLRGSGQAGRASGTQDVHGWLPARPPHQKAPGTLRNPPSQSHCGSLMWVRGTVLATKELMQTPSLPASLRMLLDVQQRHRRCSGPG